MAKRIITALDIGSTKVCAAITSLEDNEEPSVIGVATYPSEGLKKGVIVNIDDAINSIAHALEAAERMAGLTVSSVYASINGKHITSTNNKGVVAVSHDEIVSEDVFRAIESARTVSIPPSREILHVIPREFIVDSQGGIKDPVGMSGTRLEVDTHIISATSTALHNLVKCIQQLGLKIDDIVFSGWASATSVLTDTEKELGVMLLDIGGGTTSITTFVEDAITYSGCLQVGGSNVTNDLAIGLRVSLENAEKIKLRAEELRKQADKPRKENMEPSKSPLFQDKKEEKKKKEAEKKDGKTIDVSSLDIPDVKEVSVKLFDEIIEARLEEIFDLVSAQVKQAGYDPSLPAGVVITGGSASLPNITKIAQKVLNVPARVGHPSGLTGLIDEISDPAFATTQGLILYGALDEGGGNGGRSFNLGGVQEAGSSIAGKVGGWLKNLIP